MDSSIFRLDMSIFSSFFRFLVTILPHRKFLTFLPLHHFAFPQSVIHPN
jgi:hypothetical protein